MLNIKKLYISNFLTGLVFWYAIEKLFMRSIGIDAIGISINAAVYLGITVLFDVPSGVLADRWRRTYTLFLAMVCLGLSDLILGTSHQFATYLIGTVFLSFFIVLTSGTFQAIMYDSLAEIGQEKHYDRHQGRSYGLFLAGIGVSSFVGGYVAEHGGLRATYLMSIVPAVLNGILLLTVKEPQFHKGTFDAKFWDHIKGSVRVITTQPVVFHLALFLVVSGMLRFTQNEFGSLYYISLGLSAFYMGVANAGKWLSGALGQFIAPCVGRERAFKLVPWFFVMSLVFSLINNVGSLAFFFLAAILYAVASNQAEATMQGMIPSALRATTLSLTSFTTNVIMVPLSLVFGWVTQNYSIFRSYQMFAMAGLGYLVVWFSVGRSRALTATRSAAEPASVLEMVK